MKKPRMYADSGWSQSWLELTILYGLTCVAATMLLNMPWLVAATVTPAIMLAMLLAVLVVVQVLWMLVVGLESLGSAVGLRKSPLS